MSIDEIHELLTRENIEIDLGAVDAFASVDQLIHELSQFHHSLFYHRAAHLE
jgi:hypothetical protein